MVLPHDKKVFFFVFSLLFLFCFFAVRHAKLDHPFEINAERYIFVLQYISLCSWFGS